MTVIVFVLALTTSNITYAGTLTYSILDTNDDGRFTIGSGYSSKLRTEYINLSERDLYMRFKVDIPKNATITSAVIKLVPQGELNTNNSDIKIYLIDIDNCPAFEGADRCADTATYVDHIINGATWHNKIGDTDNPYEFTGLQSLIQAYIDRGGYDYHQYIGIHFAHTGSADYKMFYSSNAGSDYNPQLIITYTGGETVLGEVYMAEPYVRIKQKLYCQLVNTKAGDKLIVTVNGSEQVNKTLSAYTKGEEIVTVDYTGLTAGDQSLVVYIKNSSNINYPTSFTKNWTTLHNGIPKVGINENNAICLDGTPFFPITNFIAYPGYVASKYDGIFGAINGSLGEGYHAGGHTIATFQKYLDISNTRGNFYVAGPLAGGYSWDGFNKILPAESDTDKLVAYVQACKNYPALFAWSWDDEPNLGGVGKAVRAPVTRSWSDLCYANDTNHPTWTNLVHYNAIQDDGTPVDDFKEYMYMYNEDLFGGVKTQIWDIMGLDYYPYEYENHSSHPQISLEHYLATLDKLYEWNYNLIPIAYFVESQDVHDYYGTSGQEEYATYLTATGISTFPAFQAGETVNATSGGSGTIPTEHGNVTIASFVRPDYDTIILQDKMGTFTEGATLTGVTSGATATFVSINTERPRGYLKNYDWTPGPTPAQLRNMVWLSVIHGAKIISYFNCFCPLPVANELVLSTIKTWIEDLDQIILSGDATTTVTCAEAGNSRVDHMVKDYNGHAYIFAARVKKESGDNIGDETATFTVSGLTAGTTIAVYGESRNITAGDGTFQDTFADYDVHIYQIGRKTSFPPTPPVNLRILQ